MPRWNAWPSRIVDQSLAYPVSDDNELVTSNVVSTAELRAAVLKASNRRGRSVSRRRTAFRWLGWLTWDWILPIVGLATVLSILLMLAAWQFFGPNAVINTAQTWLNQQFGGYSYYSVPAPLPSFNVMTETVPQLQIDRNYSKQNAPNNKSVIPANAANPSPQPNNPPGARP